MQKGRDPIRNTNQRIAILEYLRERRDHPTVDDIFEAVKETQPAISRATVYRNLKYLAEQGMVQEVHLKGVTRYEPNLGSHHHVICERCGSIVDFQSDELVDHSLETIGAYKGFTIKKATTNFYGTCSKCSEGTE